MKFKVGDTVRIVKRDAESHCKDKDSYIGHVFKIDSRSVCDHFAYYIKSTGYYWSGEELEPVTLFTKSDLKDGMVVEVRNCLSCRRYLVVGDRLIGRNRWTSLSDYDEDLTTIPQDLTVDRVYTTNRCTLDSCFNDDNLALLWERDLTPLRKMTIEEIENKLGYRVEIIRG